MGIKGVSMMNAPACGVVIAAITEVIPDLEVSNEFLLQEGRLDRPRAQRALEKTGVERRRRFSAENSDPIELLEMCARRCLETTRPHDIGLIAISTCSLNRPSARLVPNPASDLRVRLGLPNAGTLSCFGGCTSFLGVLGAATDYVRLNQLAAFVAIVELDHQNTPTGVPRYLFGDGCAGVLLRPTEELDFGFVAYDRRSGTDGSRESNRIEGDMNEALVFQSWGPYANALYMSGAAVSEYILQRVPRALIGFLEQCNTSPDSIDVFVPHQANARAIEFLHRRCFPKSLLVETVRHRGNNAGASLGIAMAKAFTDRCQRGDRVLLSAFGSGPNIVNMLYRATGQEVVLREKVSANDALADSQPAKWMVSPGDGAPRYALLTPSVFDRYDKTRIRVLVTKPSEIDFFTRILPGPCSLIGASSPACETEFQMQQWAKRFKRERTTPPEPEIRGDYDDKIQCLLLRVSPFDVPSLLDDLRRKGRIDRWMVHKQHEANVMLSGAVQVGGLIHFLASPVTEEFRFDHESGHLQGMALMEIIRQAIIASSHVIGVPQEWGIVPTSFHTDYHRYVDVEAPIVVKTLPGLGKSRARRLEDWQNKRPHRVWGVAQIFQNGQCCVGAHLTGMLRPSRTT